MKFPHQNSNPQKSMPFCSSIKDGVYHLNCFSERVKASFSGRRYTRVRFPEFLKEAGYSGEAIQLDQKHTDKVVIVNAKSREFTEPADGLLTDVHGNVLCIRTADCVPVFLSDLKGSAVGLLHAGWRGIVQNILETGVKMMCEQWRIRPADMIVAFGPSIRKCCYEVGKEFEGYFPDSYYEDHLDDEASTNKGYVDLIQTCIHRLAVFGVSQNNIHDSGICTSCHNNQFYSARREKNTPERMFSVIQICT